MRLLRTTPRRPTRRRPEGSTVLCRRPMCDASEEPDSLRTMARAHTHRRSAGIQLEVGSPPHSYLLHPFIVHVQLPGPQTPHSVAGGQVDRGRVLPRERREGVAGPAVSAAGQGAGLGRGRAPHRGDRHAGMRRRRSIVMAGLLGGSLTLTLHWAEPQLRPRLLRVVPPPGRHVARAAHCGGGHP